MDYKIDDDLNVQLIGKSKIYFTSKDKINNQIELYNEYNIPGYTLYKTLYTNIISPIHPFLYKKKDKSLFNVLPIGCLVDINYEDTIIIDPANNRQIDNIKQFNGSGDKFIGAGGLSGFLYTKIPLESYKSKSKLYNNVNNVIIESVVKSMDGNSIYVNYNTHHIIHTVGPYFDTSNNFKQLYDSLYNCYKTIFYILSGDDIPNNISKVRLIPISGGIYMGKQDTNIFIMNTYYFILSAYNSLPLERQIKILSKYEYINLYLWNNIDINNSMYTKLSDEIKKVMEI